MHIKGWVRPVSLSYDGCITKESGDRVFCKKYLDNVSIDEAINVREEHEAIDEQDKDRFKGMDVTHFSRSVGFAD